MTQMSCNFKVQSKIKRTRRIPLFEGGGEQDGYPSHAPCPKLAEFPPKLAGLPSHNTTWLACKCPWVPAKESCDQCGGGGGGGKNMISSNTLPIMVISRNLFYKIEVQSLPLPYFNVKVCYLLTTSCEKRISCIYSVSRLYKPAKEAILTQSASLHSTGNI
jgi:hypothetical protein